MKDKMIGLLWRMKFIYLENYMDSHKMRHHKEIAVRFDVDVEDKC